jgi:hypothetical protein
MARKCPALESVITIVQRYVIREFGSDAVKSREHTDAKGGVLVRTLDLVLQLVMYNVLHVRTFQPTLDNFQP